MTAELRNTVTALEQEKRRGDFKISILYKIDDFSYDMLVPFSFHFIPSFIGGFLKTALMFIVYWICWQIGAWALAVVLGLNILQRILVSNITTQKHSVIFQRNREIIDELRERKENYLQNALDVHNIPGESISRYVDCRLNQSGIIIGPNAANFITFGQNAPAKIQIIPKNGEYYSTDLSEWRGFEMLPDITARVNASLAVSKAYLIRSENENAMEMLRYFTPTRQLGLVEHAPHMKKLACILRYNGIMQIVLPQNYEALYDQYHGLDSDVDIYGKDYILHFETIDRFVEIYIGLREFYNQHLTFLEG